MSDDYLRRIIDDQKKQIETLKSYMSYLDGQRKLELHLKSRRPCSSIGKDCIKETNKINL